MDKSIRIYLIGALWGLIAGSVLYFVQPIQWKGQALVRIGQISQNQDNDFIEPWATVVERLKSRSFIQAVAERAKRSEIVELLNVEEKAGMTIKPTKNGDLLVITINGGTKELVRTSIEAVVAELISKHDAIHNAYQSYAYKELTRLDSEIDVLSKRTEVILGKLSERNGAVTGILLLAAQNALENKLNRASLLREKISRYNSQPTSLLEPISISERHIFSSLWRACLVGVLSSIILIAIWIRLRK